MKLAFHHEHDAKSTKFGVPIPILSRPLRSLRPFFNSSRDCAALSFVVNHPYPNSVPFAFPIALSLSKGAANPAYPTVAVIPRLRSLSGTHFS